MIIRNMLYLFNNDSKEFNKYFFKLVLIKHIKYPHV